jgi:hypothetical protein
LQLVPRPLHGQGLFLLTVEWTSCQVKYLMVDSQSKDAPKPKGLQGYLNLISQRGKLQGFIVYAVVPIFNPLTCHFSFLT